MSIRRPAPAALAPATHKTGSPIRFGGRPELRRRRKRLVSSHPLCVRHHPGCVLRVSLSTPLPPNCERSSPNGRGVLPDQSRRALRSEASWDCFR
jgi:hypothetical protein